jgi:hypothetical protein
MNTAKFGLMVDPSSLLKLNILVEETESLDQIDAIVDHRPIGGDGIILLRSN